MSYSGIYENREMKITMMMINANVDILPQFLTDILIITVLPIKGEA